MTSGTTSCVVTATLAADANHTSATDSKTDTATKAGQTVVWDAGKTPLASATFGTSFPVSANAGSATISVSGGLLDQWGRRFGDDDQWYH